MEFARLELLIDNKINLIKDKTILILGIGGVGGYTVEALVRSGVGKIIIVDNDRVDITNLNRQIIATQETIGQAKVDVMEERIKSINPDCEVIKIQEFITKENMHLLFKEKIDYVVDACDTVLTKMELIKECLKRKIKFICSMGMGNKLDPTKLEIIDIRKTSYDPLARVIRKMISDEKIKEKILVVCSREVPIKKSSKTIGSTSFVPATAGLLCAAYIINDIVR
ncbi:MAG: tRNA threonylcarbamoyladenosine dehydratase [Bacilli bacterium]|nr:tRNA threonylcarbamoyladenosine dehydratase [Bacilli bacterium]MDD4809133.1 tRNA threonylcarbamoyladenosine dehydratase [Bacilli bacterium]